MLKELLAVMAGGALGAAARYYVGVWSAGRWPGAFPLGTLIVNLAGCFVIGLFMSLTLERWIVSPSVRLFVTVGFLGGLTTFSSFSYETLQLAQSNHATSALVSAALNVLGGILAAWIGASLGKYL